MKQTLYTFCILLTTLCHADSQEVFRVSQVGSDKTELLKVFDAVNESARAKLSAFPGIHVDSVISSTEYVVYARKPKNTRVRTGDSQRLGMGGHTYTPSQKKEPALETDASQRYYLITKKPMNLAQDEKRSDIAIYETDQTKEVPGYFNSRLRVVKEAPERPITKEQFVSDLRNGKTYTIPNYKEVMCRDCWGKGTQSKLDGGGRCSPCRGTGKTTVDLLVSW